MLRIGIVVPSEIMPDILSFISKEFSDIAPVPFPYHSIVDIPELIAGRQSQVDTFLFLGNTARHYAEKAIPHNTEWVTIPPLHLCAASPSLPRRSRRLSDESRDRHGSRGLFPARLS